jgi:hypothetical protein
VATKPEGSPFVLGLFVLLFVFSLVRKRSLRPLVWPALWCLIAIVPWRIWISDHGIRSSTPIGKGLDPGYLADRFDRVWPSVRTIVEKAFDGDWLAIVPIVLVAGLVVLAWRRSWSAPLFLAGLLAVVFLSLLWAYWVQRPGLNYLLSTSANRTVTTLVVVCGVFLPIIGAELLRGRRSYTDPDERRDESGPPPARIRARAGS